MGRRGLVGVLSLVIIVIGVLQGLEAIGVYVGLAWGTSMLPTIKPGTVVVCVRADPRTAEIGEVWAFEDSRGLVLHRVVGRWENGLIFRGDNNDAGYLEYIPYTYVRCKLIAKFP